MGVTSTVLTEFGKITAVVPLKVIHGPQIGTKGKPVAPYATFYV